MEKTSSTSLRISGGRKVIAESLALEISMQCKRVIKISDVLNFILDRHLNPTVVNDFIAEWSKHNDLPPKGDKK